MTSLGSRPADPRLRDVVLLAVAIGGLAMCITLVFLGMRAVMDIGGACAEGGPYVPAQSCPEGATAALLLGIFGGFGFGALALASGSRVGGVWAVAALLIGWSGLFASLGWNFLDYGLLNPPPGEGIVWGWLIPGVLFEVMAIGPILLVLWVGRDAGTRTIPALDMPGPAPNTFTSRTAGGRGRSADVRSGDAADTAALLARLERLADLRERGMLDASEFEAAKGAVLRDLQGRR